MLDPKQKQNTSRDATQLELPKGAIARFGKGRVQDIKYSPDNSLLAVASTIGIWLLDANSDKVLALLKEDTRVVSVLAFSPDGDLIASGSYDGTIQLWDATTHQLTRTLKTNGSVVAIAFSQDGKSLVTGNGKNIQMWNVQTWQPIFNISQGGSTISELVFSPDGKTLASASLDDNIQLWDAKSGKRKITFDEEKRGYITALAYHPRGPKVAFSPDGKSLASTAVDHNRFENKKIKIWNTQTGELQATFEQDRRGSNLPFTTVQFSKDGQTVICGSSDGTLQYWNPKTGENVKPFGEAEYEKYTLLPILPNNTTLLRKIIDTIDDNFEIWDIETGAVLTTLTGFGQAIPPIKVSVVDQKTRVSTLQNKPAEIWNIISPQFPGTIRELNGRIFTHAVAYSPNSATLVGKSSETAWLWDTNTYEQRSTFKEEYGDFVAYAFSPDGRTLAAATRWGHTIRLRNMLTAEQKLTLQGHAERITSIAFSPDGAMIASAEVLKENEHAIRLWDAKTGENLKTITNLINPETGKRLPINAVVFSPDGKRLASIDGSGEIQLWDVDTGKHKATFTSFMLDMQRWVETSTLLFSPDGSQLVSSISSSIYVWDVVSKRHENTLNGHTESVVSLAYSGDGTTLMSGSGDGTMLIWQMQSSPTTHLKITPLSIESPPIGRELTFNVNMIDGKNVTGFKFTFKFDSDALRYIPPTESDEIINNINVKAQVKEKNVITLIGNAPAGNVIDNGTIATLTFEVKEPADITLTINDALLTHKERKETHPIASYAWVIQPEIIPEDANRDWQVDAADLEYISSRLGQTGKGNSADINKDGIVDIADLVLLRKALYGPAIEPNKD